MRVFLDEPAGGAGYWSGAMYDPDLNGSFQINKGFIQARQLLLDINALGLPVGCLYVDTISPQFIADLVSWSCISSYSAQSHLHRSSPPVYQHPSALRPLVPAPWRPSSLSMLARSRERLMPSYLSLSRASPASSRRLATRTAMSYSVRILRASRAPARSLSACDRPARVMIDCPDEKAARWAGLVLCCGGPQSVWRLIAVVPQRRRAGVEAE